MSGEAKTRTDDNLVVFAGDGDSREKQEMVEVLRDLATALEDDLNVGNPLLVLEKRCLERLQEAHRKTRGAGGFSNI
jgi:hypothetical protein